MIIFAGFLLLNCFLLMEVIVLLNLEELLRNVVFSQHCKNTLSSIDFLPGRAVSSLCLGRHFVRTQVVLNNSHQHQPLYPGDEMSQIIAK